MDVASDLSATRCPRAPCLRPSQPPCTDLELLSNLELLPPLDDEILVAPRAPCLRYSQPDIHVDVMPALDLPPVAHHEEALWHHETAIMRFSLEELSPHGANAESEAPGYHLNFVLDGYDCEMHDDERGLTSQLPIAHGPRFDWRMEGATKPTCSSLFGGTRSLRSCLVGAGDRPARHAHERRTAAVMRKASTSATTW